MKALEILKRKREISIMHLYGINGICFVQDIKDLDEAIAELEALQSRSCEGCKYFRNSDKACFMSSYNTYDRPASIKFSGCGKYEPKE